MKKKTREIDNSKFMLLDILVDLPKPRQMKTFRIRLRITFNLLKAWTLQGFLSFQLITKQNRGR